jgi:hypothetical protein
MSRSFFTSEDFLLDTGSLRLLQLLRLTEIRYSTLPLSGKAEILFFCSYEFKSNPSGRLSGTYGFIAKRKH